MGIEFLIGFSILMCYFIICASTALILRKLFPIPSEVFRKLLHIILLGSILVFTNAFHTWWISAIATIVFVIIVYPVLAMAEGRLSCYSQLLIERKNGEIKRSLVVVFLMFCVLISICWGIMEQPNLVIASVLAWGLGDAAAALVGKRFGKHYIEGKLVEGKKSMEGTIAMFIVSFFSVLIVLLINTPVVWYAYIPIALITAVICAVVELYTKGGMDTITCPFAAAMILIPLVHWLGV